MNIFLLNLIQTLRSLRTQGWQVAISSVSLAVGIVCLTFSSNWLWSETHYNYFSPDYKNLYILQHADSGYGKPTNTLTYDECQGIKQQVQDGGFRLGIINSTLQRTYGNLNFAASYSGEEHPLVMLEMDTCAADLLGLPLFQGNIHEALGVDRDRTILTDKAAIKLFGRADVVGEVTHNKIGFRSHTLKSAYEIEYKGKSMAYIWRTHTVKAVCEAPDRMSNFEYDIILPLSKIPLDNEVIVHTKDPKKTIERLSLYKPDKGEKKQYVLQPLRTYKAYKSMSEKSSFIETYFYQSVFTLIALLLVVSAVTNLVMVYTSVCLARVREYALRRSMGASTWQNVQWILTGAMPALIFGGLLSGVAMEWITKFVEIPWDTTFIFQCYAGVLLLTLLLCVIGMAYPICKMRRAYRASFLGHGDGGRSHQWLIIVQCLACALLLFISLGMQRQISGMLNADLGYDHKNMLRLETGMLYFKKPEGFTKYYDFDGIYKDLVQELGKEAGGGIIDVLPMESDIFNRIARNKILVVDENVYPEAVMYLNEDNIYEHIKHMPHISMNYVEIPFRAIEFFNIRTALGQILTPEEESADMLQVFLNNEAMRLVAPGGVPKKNYHTLGLHDGMFSVSQDNNVRHWEAKRLNIRDVANIRTTDFYTAATPTIYVGVEAFHNCSLLKHDAIYIKYAEGRREEAEAAVRQILAKFDVPEELYLLNTLDEHIKGVYKKEAFIANLLTYLTVFSVVVTLAGVFSMLLYSLRLRRRSMAIHRVMGATFKDIFIPTLRPYLIYAVIGAVLAYFPAYILMRKWMEYFHYGETPGVGLMLSILGGMVLIITLIVWWQVSLCMKEKPVEILKPES